MTKCVRFSRGELAATERTKGMSSSQSVDVTRTTTETRIKENTPYGTILFARITYGYSTRHAINTGRINSTKETYLQSLHLTCD